DDPDKLVPARGVYAVDVCYDEQWYKGMMNIGVRPTFEFDSLTLEVNLFNFEASIYNEKIVVRLKHFVRPEKKFASVEALREQLEKDKTFCENV
ncbi:MAG TPA: riboflavin kinase, partial [Calditrichia bacterium]|nr:riboflavin kinase [Calditrichia bacterium]